MRASRAGQPTLGCGEIRSRNSPTGLAQPLCDGRPGGQDKSELRAAAGRAVHGDGAAERLDQALDDVQAQAGAAAALAAPELAEDPGGHLPGNALPLVAHGHGDRPIAVNLSALYHASDDTTTVADGVLHEVAGELVDLVGVQPGLGQALRGGLEAEPVFRLARRDPAPHDPLCPGRDVNHPPAAL